MNSTFFCQDSVFESLRERLRVMGCGPQHLDRPPSRRGRVQGFERLRPPSFGVGPGFVGGTARCAAGRGGGRRGGVLGGGDGHRRRVERVVGRVGVVGSAGGGEQRDPDDQGSGATSTMHRRSLAPWPPGTAPGPTWVWQLRSERPWSAPVGPPVPVSTAF